MESATRLGNIPERLNFLSTASLEFWKRINFKKEIPFIRKRCSHLKEKELKEAEERFREYVRICLEIGKRLESEKTDFDRNSKYFYNEK